MKVLIEREFKISKSSLLIGIGILVIVGCIGAYQVFFSQVQDVIGVFPALALLATTSVILNPAIKDDKDNVLKFLYTLPLNVKSIVGSKFIYINTLFLLLELVTVIYMTLMGILSQAATFITIASTLVSISTALITINLILLAYYALGAQNMQYGVIGATMLVFIITKYSINFNSIYIGIIILLSSIFISVVAYNMSCRLFKRRLK